MMSIQHCAIWSRFEAVFLPRQQRIQQNFGRNALHFREFRRTQQNVWMKRLQSKVLRRIGDLWHQLLPSELFSDFRQALPKSNEKRRLDAPVMKARMDWGRSPRRGSSRIKRALLGRLAVGAVFQTLHLVFEAQLELLEPHFL